MKIGKGELVYYVLLAYLAIYLHKIIAFSNAQILCNRTCGSTTVRYPFGFSGDCPYILDNRCSENGDVFIKGYKVFNFTSTSIIVAITNEATTDQCDQKPDILSVFKEKFGLSSRNVLLLKNCTNLALDCKFNISSSVDVFSKGNSGGRGNCRGADVTNFSCLSKNESGWLPWARLEDSKCKSMLSNLICWTSPDQKGSIIVDFDKVELGWWVDGPCLNNSCSAHAICTEFQNPNTRLRVHTCQCRKDFEGDGFAQGFGCTKGSGCNASGYVSGRCGKNSRVVVLICALIAGAIVVVVIVIVYCFFKRGTSAMQRRKSRKRLLSAHGGSFSIPIYSYKDLEKATKGFSEKERLGSGAFGTVYAGKLPACKGRVAVKRIRHRDAQGIEQVLNEIKIVSSVNHPNLVRLLGCCLEKGEPILVYEFMPNGTLSQHLQRERGEGLPWRTRVTIAAETAHALAFLHSATHPPIYHRDVKSSNILLDYDFNSKVADFGLSRLVLSETSHISTAPQGTPGYVDPQYHQNFHLSDKSDVYSFGVVLVEIITALKVVDFSRNKSEINLACLAISKIGRGRVDEIIDPFLEANKDLWVRKTVHRVAELAFRCLAFDRDARPTMLEVAEELEMIGQTEETATSNGLLISDDAAPSIQENDGSDFSSNDSITNMKIIQSQMMGESKRVIVDRIHASSPASVHDPWISTQSSPSSSSFIGNLNR
eukprot:Gb_02535 [translate_table: standard]